MVALRNTSRNTFVVLELIVRTLEALMTRLLSCGNWVSANTDAPPLIVKLNGEVGRVNALDSGVFVPVNELLSISKVPVMALLNLV